MDLGESTRGTWPGQSLSCPHSATEIYLEVLESHLERWRLTVAHCGDKDTDSRGPRKIFLLLFFLSVSFSCCDCFYYLLFLNIFFKFFGFFLFVFVCSSFAFLICFPFLFYYFFVFVSSVLIDCFYFKVLCSLVFSILSVFFFSVGLLLFSSFNCLGISLLVCFLFSLFVLFVFLFAICPMFSLSVFLFFSFSFCSGPAAQLAGSGLPGQLLGLDLWSGNIKFRMLDHQRIPGSMEY